MLIKSRKEKINNKRLILKYDLSKKVDGFCDDFANARKKAPTMTDIGEFYAPNQLRDFIESYAVFSELRYPEVYSPSNEFIPKPNEKFSWKEFEETYRDLKISIPKNIHDFDWKFTNSILSRIIERGENRSGGRRAFYIAKEKEWDLKMPLIYAICDYSDPHAEDFLKNNLNFIENPDLDEILVPMNYFSAKANPNKNKLNEESLRQVMSHYTSHLLESMNCK